MQVVIFYENRKLRKIKSEGEKLAGKILEDKELTETVVVCLALILTFSTKIVFGVESTGIDRLGNVLLKKMQNIGKWAALLLCFKDIIQTILEGGRAKDLGGVIIKYSILLGSLYYVPKLFDAIPTFLD